VIIERLRIPFGKAFLIELDREDLEIAKVFARASCCGWTAP
jgi:hypothetical protein